MSYRNIPGAIITGRPSVATWLLRPEYKPASGTYLDGPLDATDAIPCGSIRYQNWGTPYEVQPYHQAQRFMDREQILCATL